MSEQTHERKTAKKIGELLIEMGFVTEDQLQKALAFAKKKNIKAGEAMVEMGLISKDHVYWILGSQLNMSYIEVQPDTIDAALVRQFPLDELRRLQCIPLYESKDEVHFALADPTDTETIRRLTQSRPHMRVMLNLALPDNIEAALNHFDKSASGAASAIASDAGFAPVGLEAKPVASEEVLLSPGSGEFLKRDLKQMVDQLTPEEILWFELMGIRWRAFVTSGAEARPLRAWQRDNLAGITGIIRWLDAQSPRLAPEDRAPARAVLWGRLNGLVHQLIWVRRLPVFDREDFLKSEPAAEAMLASLRAHIERYRRALVGTPVPSIVKRCWFASQPAPVIEVFPRPITIETQIEYLNRDVMQLEDISTEIRDTLLRISPTLLPPILLEIDPRLNDAMRLGLAPMLETCSSQLIVLIRVATRDEFDAACAHLPEPIRSYEKLYLAADPRQPTSKPAR